MAKLGCGTMPQQLLYPRGRTMSTTGRLCCDRTRQPSGCSASDGVHSALSMLQPKRSAILGLRTKFRVSRTALRAHPKTRQEFMSTTNAPALTDIRAPDIFERREEAQIVASSSTDAAANDYLSGFDLEALIHGHVGRFAFLSILLLGVGVGCLTSAGDAEAAVSHVNNGNLDVDMRALALGPEGPLLEEFWDNMRRYGLYFLTVVTGGVYQLVKPAVDALKNPVTAVLIIVIVTGSLYLVGLTVSAMLGINEYQYDYAI